MGRSLLKINGKIPNRIKSYNNTAIIKLKGASGPVIIDLNQFNIASLTDVNYIKSLIIGNYIGTTGVSDIQQPTVSWDATSAVIKYKYGEIIEYDDVHTSVGIEHSAESSSFEQNLTDQPIVRNVTFTAVDGKTYTTTVTQKAHGVKNYEITLAGISASGYGFVEAKEAPSAMPNLDLSTYDGVYASTNQKKSSTQAVARIDFHDMPNFTVWINSYAESSYDYTIASELDVPTYPTEDSWTTAKASTKGSSYQKAVDRTATAPADPIWKKVTYSNDGGNHFIYIVYRKDSSDDSYDDTGRFIVEVNG